jgi:hypothetical protein
MTAKLIIDETGYIMLEDDDEGIIKSGVFHIGDRVRKKLSENAGEWQGHIVGAYMTNNGIGYAVRSEREKKSIQIYPESALEIYNG